MQYLADSPITDRKRSMDKFGGLYHYGVWIYFRYLTEKFPTKQGFLPEIILDFWKAADSSKGAAQGHVLHPGHGRGAEEAEVQPPLDKAFSLFSDANRRARTVYDEGAANDYPVRRLSGQKALGKGGSQGVHRQAQPPRGGDLPLHAQERVASSS